MGPEETATGVRTHSTASRRDRDGCVMGKMETGHLDENGRYRRQEEKSPGSNPTRGRRCPSDPWPVAPFFQIVGENRSNRSDHCVPYPNGACERRPDTRNCPIPQVHEDRSKFDLSCDMIKSNCGSRSVTSTIF